MTRARDTADGVARSITDGIIVNDDINSSAAIAQSKVESLSTDLDAKSDVILSTNQKATSYTISILDIGKQVEMSGGGTLTVPLNSSVAFPIGTSILITQTGASQVTIAGSVGVTVNSSNGLKLYGQWSSALLMKRATDTWLLSGDTTA
jgi:hypothetical protein